MFRHQCTPLDLQSHHLSLSFRSVCLFQIAAAPRTFLNHQHVVQWYYVHPLYVSRARIDVIVSFQSRNASLIRSNQSYKISDARATLQGFQRQTKERD
jgi:hypothetical protein